MSYTICLGWLNIQEFNDFVKFKVLVLVLVISVESKMGKDKCKYNLFFDDSYFFFRRCN